MKRIAALLCLFLFTAFCGPAWPAGGAQRIVSLAPSITEALDALG
jgi:ABC-type Fe3+-hydroxamate transport system substrate-binding protein